MNNANKSQQQLDAEAEIQKVMVNILELLGNEKHSIALAALLSVFRNIALQHGCCTFVSAIQAGKVASELMLHSHNAPQAPGQQHLH